MTTPPPLPQILPKISDLPKLPDGKMFGRFGYVVWFTAEQMHDYALAALATQQKVVAIPEGMALVPIEPTEKMTRSMSLSYFDEDCRRGDIHYEIWVQTYKAAINAAPQPLAGQQDGGEAKCEMCGGSGLVGMMTAEGGITDPCPDCEARNLQIDPLFPAAHYQHDLTPVASPPPPVREPLTDFHREAIWQRYCPNDDFTPARAAFSRGMEEAHGIGPSTQGVDHG